MKQDDTTITEGSGNVFADFGYKNPEEAQIKSRIALRIHKAIEEKGLSQREAAKAMGIGHAKVSAIVNGKLKGYSIDRLFRFLNALDVNVTIKLQPKPARQDRATTKVV